MGTWTEGKVGLAAGEGSLESAGWRGLNGGGSDGEGLDGEGLDGGARVEGLEGSRNKEARISLL